MVHIRNFLSLTLFFNVHVDLHHGIGYRAISLYAIGLNLNLSFATEKTYIPYMPCVLNLIPLHAILVKFNCNGYSKGWCYPWEISVREAQARQWPLSSLPAGGWPGPLLSS